MTSIPSSASSWGRGLAPSDARSSRPFRNRPMSGMLCTSYSLRERGLLVDVDLHDLVGALAHRRDLLDDRARPGGTVRTTAPRSRRSRAVRPRAPRSRSSRWSPASPGPRAAARAAAPTALAGAHGVEPRVRVLHALERDLVAHRVLAVDDAARRARAAPPPRSRLFAARGSSGRRCRAAAAPGRRAPRPSRRRTSSSRDERAHREHAGRVRTVAATQTRARARARRPARTRRRPPRRATCRARRTRCRAGRRRGRAPR